MTGSRMLIFGDAMSIFARSVRAAVGKLARSHALEKIEIFFHGAIAIRAVLARLGRACRDIRGSDPRSNRRRTPCRS